MENCITNQHGQGPRKRKQRSTGFLESTISTEHFFHPSQGDTSVLNEGRENNIRSVWCYALKACCVFVSFFAFRTCSVESLITSYNSVHLDMLAISNLSHHTVLLPYTTTHFITNNVGASVDGSFGITLFTDQFQFLTHHKERRCISIMGEKHNSLSFTNAWCNTIGAAVHSSHCSKFTLI